MAFSVLECVRIVGDVVSSSGLFILGLLKSYQMKCAVLQNSGCLLLDLNSKIIVLIVSRQFREGLFRFGHRTILFFLMLFCVTYKHGFD